MLLDIGDSGLIDTTGPFCCFEVEPLDLASHSGPVFLIDDGYEFGDIITVVVFAIVVLNEIPESMVAVWLAILMVVLFQTTVLPWLTLTFPFLLRLTEGWFIIQEYIWLIFVQLKVGEVFLVTVPDEQGDL